MHPDSKPLLWKSMVMLAGSKSLAIASPYILKKIVDGMTLGVAMDFNTVALGIGCFGLARIGATMFQEARMI